MSGTIENARELFMNGELVSIESGGAWEKGVALEPGLNTIEIRAKKFLGRETTITRQIFYTPPATSSVATST